MKLFLFIIVLSGVFYAIITFPARDRAQNRIQCAVLGYQEDCKTHQTQEQIKCDNFYKVGMCGANGEVYPEYTKEALKIQSEGGGK